MSNRTSEPEPTQIYGTTSVSLPRVAIKFCVRCKWNLRAAYYAQELLQTFSFSLGEVALVPATTGSFVVTLSLPQSPVAGATGAAAATDTPLDGMRVEDSVTEFVLWDRKVDGGFPETKELKRRVRDLVEPGRGLGHVDRDYDASVKKEGGGLKREGGEEAVREEAVGEETVGGETGGEEKGEKETDEIEKGRGRKKDGENEKEPPARCEDCA